MAALLKWPDWMPKPLTNGYSVKTTDTRAVSGTEAGSIIRMQFPGADLREAEGSLLLDLIEQAWFESFERYLLHNGLDWFRMPLLSGGSVSPHLARFRDRPALTGFHGTFARYDFTLDVIPIVEDET